MLSSIFCVINFDKFPSLRLVVESSLFMKGEMCWSIYGTNLGCPKGSCNLECRVPCDSMMSVLRKGKLSSSEIESTSKEESGGVSVCGKNSLESVVGVCYNISCLTFESCLFALSSFCSRLSMRLPGVIVSLR